MGEWKLGAQALTVAGMTRALKRPHLSQINTGGLGGAPAAPPGVPRAYRAKCKHPGRKAASRLQPNRADAALNSQFTFFSSMARSRKRRSQFDIGVSFMLSNQETNKYWNPPGKQNWNLFTRAQLAPRRRGLTSSKRGAWSWESRSLRGVASAQAQGEVTPSWLKSSC